MSMPSPGCSFDQSMPSRISGQPGNTSSMALQGNLKELRLGDVLQAVLSAGNRGLLFVSPVLLVR